MDIPATGLAALLMDHSTQAAPGALLSRIADASLSPATQQASRLQPGIWFPLQGFIIQEDLAQQGSYERYNYHAEDAVANESQFDPAIFKADIPIGWIVADDRQPKRRSYVTMEDGTELEIHTGDTMPQIEADIAKRPDGLPAAVYGPAWW